MQPLAYFAVRMLLGWMQYMERADRAFVSSGLVIIATGAAHAWAVVYALFIAIHMRAMRFDGYHEGYKEHLPFWVSWTETLAVASMGVWWLAGFATAAVRILDDDARGLPSEARDVDVGPHLRLLRSPGLRAALAAAHALSCAGLFVSILLLCVALALMKGVVTACEVCLCLVSGGFALPHAAVASRHLRREAKAERAAASAEAAAREAAALGPQLCVILALADSPGHAYLWQNLAYLAAAGAFALAVWACFDSPPRVSGSALPPEPAEALVCALLSAAASVALIICFPHLNTWHLWVLAVMLLALFAALLSEGWRELLVELLDPLLALRSEEGKALPGGRRQALRGGARTAAGLCALVALWDIILHPVQQGLLEEPDFEEGPPELWDQSKMLMLRWRPTGEPSEQQLLAAAAEALDLEPAALAARARFPQHRLLLFAGAGAAESGVEPLHARWGAALASGRPALAEAPFPAALNVTLCLHAHASAELARQHSEEAAQAGAAAGVAPAMPDDFLAVVGASPEAHHAYLAACDWWTDRLDSYYGSDEEAQRHLAEAGAPEGERDAGENGDEQGVDAS